MWTHESIEYVTVAGEAWLASASDYPRSLRALRESRPCAPTVLPCGRTFDVVNMPSLFGRRVLDELWAAGPGCGPVATHRGRILLFAQVGTADQLRTLLTWEEWARELPPLLCHGQGDAVTVPPVQRALDGPPDPGNSGRWIVAPDTLDPWLPGTAALLRACVRAARNLTRPDTSTPPPTPSSASLAAPPPATAEDGPLATLHPPHPRPSRTDF
jgi:hypothetical protein